MVRLRPPDDALIEAMEELRYAVLRHPVAAQAAFSALAAEGRRFAQTAEGRRWQARLAGSSLVTRVRAVWDAATLELLEDPDAILPSNLADALVHLADHPELERLLQRLAWGQDGG